ncbi:MAG: hypothetical protein IPL08_09810 [Saprospiraceae bacterium]|nr:hypothetical protein [Saprospiraceae bacterium]
MPGFCNTLIRTTISCWHDIDTDSIGTIRPSTYMRTCIVIDDTIIVVIPNV